ncbi:MAG: hypothetical protein Kow0031_10570 [Anaerolineae bacterium]
MGYTNRQIREFLTDFFAADAEEFEFFCDDYYAAVKEQFEAGMSPKKRAHLLTLHVTETDGVEQLLSNLKAYDPATFQAKAGLLLSAPAGVAAESPASAREAAPADRPVDVPNGEAVFISYSRRDEEFIRQLYGELTGRGISAWYDRENIGVATQWAAQIVEGIKNCQVFVLALSPDSAASENVRKEVDLAQRYQKKIVPLIWRPTEIPIAMEYQLAGIQWIEFNQNTSPEKFEQLASALRRLMGGASLPEAVAGTPAAAEAAIPAPPETAPPPPQKRSLLQLEREQTVSSTAVGGAVISGVVTTLGLKSGSQDLLNGDLKWLFAAADHFLRVQQNPALRGQPIGVAVPDRPETNVAMLATIDDFDLQIWRGQVESALKRIKIHLDSLDILLVREAKGDPSIHLQTSIKDRRLEIVKILRELAEIMKQAYGVSVDSPNQLLQILQ